MEKARVLTIAGLTIIVALLFTAEAYGWATVANVWTTDADDVPKETFLLGEEVYVHWMADGMVNITAYYESGDVDEEWANLGKSGTVSFVPEHGVGYYDIVCTGAEKLTIAYATIHVIPEFLFGTIGGVGGLSAAFALFGILKRRRS
ncbi:hypothetical protein KAU92_00380 [Candidatus Bathyarchaeota archaeon]|nr:hypothetical protein [Candidatus Bathyarchaeota archaeon]